MADQLRKSNQKRTLQGEQLPVVERQEREKREESSNVEADTDAAAPITNICNELLDRIVDLLDFESLLNVADTCTRLRNGAAAKFGRKFGDRSFYLYQGFLPECISIAKDHCKFGLKYYLPLLRCFGGKISNLFIINDSKVANECDENLQRYINQYCADTLTTLICYSRVFPIDGFSKPMKNVTKLKIVDCDLGEQLPKFVKWFPSLRDLKFTLFTKFDGRLAVSFPHLESLTLKLDTSGHLNSKCATELLHANPQLKYLCIAMPYEKRFDQLLSMLSGNPSLLKLEVWGNIKDVNAVALNQFSKNHPLLEELELGGPEFSVELAVLLSRKLIHLKSLIFRFDDPAKRDQLLIQLDSHWQRSISSVKYYGFHDIVLSKFKQSFK